MKSRLLVKSTKHGIKLKSLFSACLVIGLFANFQSFNSSLSWRHISNYRLDGEDDSIRAAGHDVVDFSVSRRLKKWIDLSFSIDNVLNKRYFETQNYFESRLTPTSDVISRIHATPSYPTTFNFGITFRLGSKQ